LFCFLVFYFVCCLFFVFVFVFGFPTDLSTRYQGPRAAPRPSRRPRDHRLPVWAVLCWCVFRAAAAALLMITWTNIYLALCAAPVAHLSPVRPSRSVAVGRPLPPRRSSPGLSLVYGHDLPGCGGGERGMRKQLLPQRQLSDEHGGTLWVTHFGAGACAFLPPGFPVWVARPRYCLVFVFCLFGLFLFLFARPRLHQPPLFRQPRHFLASRRGP
jgi:hypothetical protein